MANNNKPDKRSRTWTCVAYPESAPENWRDLLDENHFQWLESPLHDKDTNPDGTVKKSHWHILLKFGSKKSYRQVDNIVKECLHGPNPQVVHDLKGMIRYFVHIDNPEKYQYNREDLVEHGGFDIGNAFASSSIERYELIHEMIDFVRENEIEEISELIDYAVENRFDDWFPLLADNSLKIMDTYIKNVHFSKRDKRREEEMKNEKQKQLDDQYKHDQKVAERAVNEYKNKQKKKQQAKKPKTLLDKVVSKNKL